MVVHCADAFLVSKKIVSPKNLASKIGSNNSYFLTTMVFTFLKGVINNI